jgi:hypothetical protein
VPELYAALHNSYSYAAADVGGKRLVNPPPGDIATQSLVTVECNDPRSGLRGKRTFKWFDSGSLAAELWVFAVGALDQHVHITGGPLLLVEELPDVLWSMALHRRWTGLCVPPAQRRGQQWSATWPGLHLQKALGVQQSEASSTERRAIAMPSASAAASFALAGLRMGFELPCFAAVSEKKVPATIEALPRWWTDATLPWERAFAGFVQHPDNSKASLPCMHFLSPSGCSAGATACAALHDDEWAKFVSKMKRESDGLLGTGGDVYNDALDVDIRGRSLATAGLAAPEAPPKPNGLASTPQWQLPDATAVAFLSSLAALKAEPEAA